MAQLAHFYRSLETRERNRYIFKAFSTNQLATIETFLGGEGMHIRGERKPQRKTEGDMEI